MFTKMKIGDFAKYNQISVQALRYYESIDLIHPIEIDPFTNYRYYHIKQSAVIDNIQFFQDHFSYNECYFYTNIHYKFDHFDNNELQKDHLLYDIYHLYTILHV